MVVGVDSELMAIAKIADIVAARVVDAAARVVDAAVSRVAAGRVVVK